MNSVHLYSVRTVSFIGNHFPGQFFFPDFSFLSIIVGAKLENVVTTTRTTTTIMTTIMKIMVISDNHDDDGEGDRVSHCVL